MSNNRERVAVTESHPMNGGHGIYSYTKNSSFQRINVNAAKATIHDAIANKLDIKELFFSKETNNNSTIFNMVDLGCSVGPNTFSVMEEILEVVKQKYQQFNHQQQGLNFSSSKELEFQVFFNDQVTNDFNTLFTTLPTERHYFAAGVPGSFHDQLFPSSSLHLVHSSYALHWLSSLPKELVDENSPAFNRGRIHYSNTSDEVGKAYEAQFGKDMAKFLDARAKELVVGGLMVLTLLSVPNDFPCSQSVMYVLLELLGSSLMDLAKEGLISENQVDTFNIPLYSVLPNEMTKLIEENGCFSIERMELMKTSMIDYSDNNGEVTQLTSAETITLHLRAILEVLLTKHFGSEIIDGIFDRFYKKVEELSDQLQPIYKEGGFQLILVLKRK
ncbi:loganic acid O-methyltransferase-like [Cannabis sativa]|uniref:loganic acid O-methyltransferase-like n=1 Tax=Cannabis sativa TaxID=3483 RepID=UPI0029CA94C7|nr:loganic acid O-methyltransferase-like [Cannabis sativa]